MTSSDGVIMPCCHLSTGWRTDSVRAAWCRTNEVAIDRLHLRSAWCSPTGWRWRHGLLLLKQSVSLRRVTTRATWQPLRWNSYEWRQNSSRTESGSVLHTCIVSTTPCVVLPRLLCRGCVTLTSNFIPFVPCTSFLTAAKMSLYKRSGSCWSNSPFLPCDCM